MEPHEKQAYRFSADIGGTFSDVVLVGPDGGYWTRKVPSTPDDFSLGVLSAMGEMLAQAGVVAGKVEEVVHGTTVATNAVLEGTGAKTALITTKGFRDVLELRRLRVPFLYNLMYTPPPPIVPRRLRLEVEERIGVDGEVIIQLDLRSVKNAVEFLRSQQVEAVAVCLIHSYRNQGHERAVGDIVTQLLPEPFLSLSVDVLPEIKEYERTSTTVVNAYLGPIIERYVNSFTERLESSGIRAPLRIMQSSGGIMSADRAVTAPVELLESGPAAGVIGAQRLGERIGQQNIVTFDMGGTTAKASLIEGGEPSLTTEYEVGAGISISSRLVKGGGHAVKVPVIDLAEVGAGGGSVVWVDSGGLLKVGPSSAGAQPGPACYSNGGTEPTVTDANVVLGYINPTQLAGGAVRLNAELAHQALQEKVADGLGMELLETAFGVHSVANATMIRAIRAVSTYRGRDPRDFVMIPFGGNGPIHAAHMAAELGIKRLIVPPSPGLFSAVGLLEARPEHRFVQTFISGADELDSRVFAKAFEEFETSSLASLKGERYTDTKLQLVRSADLRYSGQAHELTVPCPTGDVERSSIRAMVDSFHVEHDRTYGHSDPQEPVEVVNMRLVASSQKGGWSPNVVNIEAEKATYVKRDAYFGSGPGLLITPVVTRAAMVQGTLEGPAIVEEYDSTTVIPPGWRAHLDDWGNIVIEAD
jgi:N-methylhydantoinase A